MRSIWAGAISFGLVVIPVKLYAATEQRDITFRQVHRKDGARIQFRRVCTLDGEEVPYSDIAKGYELPTGDMVVLTDEDLADLPLMTEDFEPDQYKDAYREALEAVVQAKIEGNDIVRPDGLDLPEAKKQPADLTEILRASVAAAKGGRGQSDQDEDGQDDKPSSKSGTKAKPRRRASA